MSFFVVGPSSQVDETTPLVEADHGVAIEPIIIGIVILVVVVLIAVVLIVVGIVLIILAKVHPIYFREKKLRYEFSFFYCLYI